MNGGVAQGSAARFGPRQRGNEVPRAPAHQLRDLFGQRAKHTPSPVPSLINNASC